MYGADHEPVTLFGERDHRAVRARERGRFTRDETREVFERKRPGGRETDVVEDGELLGAATFALAELPVRVQGETSAGREDQHGKRDRAVDQVGEASRDALDIGVDEKERARRGDHAWQHHARQVNGRP